jgi:hypothetical protein
MCLTFKSPPPHPHIGESNYLLLTNRGLLHILDPYNILPKPITIFKVPPPYTQKADVHFPQVFNAKTFFFLLLHIFDHLTKWYFFFKLPPCQKNLLLNLYILSIFVLGIKNIDMWYITELHRLELIRMVLPPLDRDPPCHTSKFLAIFSSNFIQSITWSLLGDIDALRYFKGNTIV